MNGFDLVVFSLASWRIASIITKEDGPFDIFVKFRSLLGVKYDIYGNPIAESWIGRGISCLWCMSVWVAFFVSLTYELFAIRSYEDISFFVVRLMVETFCISALAIMIDLVINVLKNKED